ncbi:Adenosine 5'-monophosphoramidase [Sorochytrium milnesiophthora]
MQSCLFCRIIRKEIPSFKLVETDKSFAFLDISPLSEGHALVIPKCHGEKLHDIPADELSDIMPVAQKVVNALREATGMEDYNILQNNGAAAHQVVKHVHFHIIPKRADDGLSMVWMSKNFDNEELKQLHAKVVEHIK